MRNKISYLIIFVLLLQLIPVAMIAQDKPTKRAEITHLNLESFKKDVWNFEKNPGKWIYEGKKPCIIDFYASWCRPCKQMEPILHEIANEYKDDIVVYKINIDKQTTLAQLFGVSQIPAMLFVPTDTIPQMSIGLLPKATVKEAIDIILLNKK